MFGMFFFIVGILWYVRVIDSFSGIQKWVEDVVKTGYDKTQQLSDEIGKTVDKKKDVSSSQRHKQFLYWACIWAAWRNKEG